MYCASASVSRSARPRQHLDADARRRHEHGAELPGIKHQQLHRRHRHDVGRAHATVEERQLPEVAPGSEAPNLLLAHPARSRPFEDQEELTPRLSLLREVGALLGPDRRARAGRWRAARAACSWRTAAPAGELDLLLGDPTAHVDCPFPPSSSGNGCWGSVPPRRPAGSRKRRDGGQPAVAQALPQHELLDLPRRRARQLVDDPELLGPLLAGQARRLPGAPARPRGRAARSPAACGRRHSRARPAARRAPPPPPPRPRPSCAPGAARPRPRSRSRRPG